ncbi:MAG: chemotaxis protein CheW [Proteobacteria bacterium]|nr:chemotaxis protein CheW [Pseudomonadota bacterium]MBU1741297.1 chemotaxis protein CheW [Pseudomonadota bacterium]
MQLVTFVLEGEEFGIDIGMVKEINRLMKITPVPKAPAAVEGVINLRGQVVPVVDLRREFKMAPRQEDRNTRIVVVEMEEMTVGFMVDAVSEVLTISRSSVEPPPAIIGGLDSDLVNGVAKIEDRLVIILDLARVVDRVVLVMAEADDQFES